MRYWSRALSVAMLAVLAQLQAFAQPLTFRSTVELVSLNVSVTGEDAHPVTGLTQEQFQVFEDGVLQELKFFSSGEMPLDVVILIDTSASMTGSMDLVQQAATRFARSLRDDDRAAVMGISDRLRVLQPFSDDWVVVEAAIRQTKPAGRTPLYASLYAALKELDKIRTTTTQPRRQAIVVLSDGQDTSSTFTFEELLTIVRQYAVPIYVIAPRRPQEYATIRQLYGDRFSAVEFELKRLAAETGARSFFPLNLVELGTVYDEVASELAQQYTLAYQSSNLARDGKYRRIALKITAPGLTWRTRPGYIVDNGSVAAGRGEY